MTDKQALRERYSPKQDPKCHICGAEMTIQRMSASRITYGCTGAIYDDKGCHYTAGRSIADDHYAQSRVTAVDVSDPEVLALLDELEAAEQRNAELIHNHRVHAARLIDERGQLKQRIAELRDWNAGLAQESFTHQQRIAELESLLSAISKSRPGGAYFCKWDGKINEVLNHGK